jgi:hypothetical protein
MSNIYTSFARSIYSVEISANSRYGTHLGKLTMWVFTCTKIPVLKGIPSCPKAAYSECHSAWGMEHGVNP